MKILVLTNSDVGLYRFRKSLLQTLLQDHTVCIALPDGSYLPQLKEMGCQIRLMDVDRRGKNPLKDLQLFFRYRKLLCSERPDVVITYTIKPNVYGGLACRLLGIPQIANVTGLGTSIENKGLLQRLTLLLYRMGLKKAKCVFFQNRHNMEFMHAHGIAQHCSRLLPGSGVDLQDNPFEDYPADDGSVRFLFVGRIMKDKGIEELLDCAGRIHPQLPHVTFDIVGDFDETVYETRMNTLQAQGSICHLGFRHDIHDLMACHHAIVLPSYHEGLSNVLLEAAACGRPVITTNVPGCRETFDEGVSGFGVPARDAKALEIALRKFIDLPYSQKAKMGRMGREKVVGTFDRRLVIEAYCQEIKKLT